MHQDSMQWIQWSSVKCIPSEWSGIHAAWLNAVDSIQCGECIPIECRIFHAALCIGSWWNAEDSRNVAQRYLIECRGSHAALLKAVDSMQSGAMYLDYWNVFYAAWCNWYRFNAMDSIQLDWMQWIPCSVAQCIPIKCSGFYAVRPKVSQLNAVVPCGITECSGFDAAW